MAQHEQMMRKLGVWPQGNGLPLLDADVTLDGYRNPSGEENLRPL